MTLPDTMRAVVTMGHGGLDQLVFHEDWPRPDPTAGEVLIRIGACGLNNTDVNTRSGWYSKAVTERTTGDAFTDVDEEDPTWGGRPLTFPAFRVADVCGEIVAVGDGIDASRIGERVITDNWLRDPTDPLNKNKTGYFGSERDGGFAEYTTIPATNALAVRSGLSDAELATFSCSYSTAEGMLTRAHVGNRDTVLVPGASGGVGGALVQLARLRGARVIALGLEAKHDAVAALGPDRILPRAPDDLRDALGDETITVVADVVGGPYWPTLIDILKRGGRYTCSGAIAGPIVDLDLRTFYLRDLTFTGSTVIAPEVMPAIIRYIENGDLQPVLAATYPLAELREAQAAFIAKQHTGNIRGHAVSTTLIAEAAALHAAHPALAEFVAWPDDLGPGVAQPHPHGASALMCGDPGLRDTTYPGLVNALIDAAPQAQWRETYKGTALYDQIMHRFGCYEIIGLTGFAASQKMRSFVVYMPAGFHYPWHEHPAEELYVVLAGEAVFQMKGEPDRTLRPGDTAFHPSGAPHATTTTDKPVLCYVVWRNHFETAPVWTPKDDP